MKRKVLFFNHASVIGGAGLSLLSIIDSLDKQKYDITVYCTANKTQIAEQLEKRGINVIRAMNSPACYMQYNGGARSILSPRYYKNLIKIQKDKARIKNAIEKVKPDLVVVNSMTLAWIGKLAKKAGCETICFHRESYANGWLNIRKRKLAKSLDKYFDKIAFISNFDMKETCLKRAKGMVIPDCVEVDKYDKISKEQAREKLGLDKNAFYVLFVGGISKLKGLHVAMQAISESKNPNAKLLVLNAKNFEKPQKEKGIKQKIKSLIYFDEVKFAYKKYKKLVNKDRIIFLPPSDEVHEWYAACDVVVFPSTKAHQAVPIYEAGVAKRLMIISDYPNTQEYLRDLENGLTFKPLNSSELSKKIDWASENAQSAQYKKMIEQNEAMTIQKHKLEDYGLAIRKMFDNE